MRHETDVTILDAINLHAGVTFFDRHGKIVSCLFLHFISSSFAQSIVMQTLLRDDLLSCGHWILSPARLPIPPRRRWGLKLQGYKGSSSGFRPLAVSAGR